ncbi:hypothetical protein J1N35_021053 [Gossypium stocksii]|uniref:Uncharacterized protein n=1 Tax=Gossypium stocksii TaxID=47602 RepID=A0A9D4A1H0_9ROSI|nr:hypothetical protein J1N35_021053 [Gossypium stocksii]
MLHMRMIQGRHGTYPPQYQLLRDAQQEDPEDIPNDVLPPQEDAPIEPPPPRRPAHTVASYADLSECLSRFEQQCFQCFDHIDATLQQIFQHLHITARPPPPPRDPSED